MKKPSLTTKISKRSKAMKPHNNFYSLSSAENMDSRKSHSIGHLV